MGIDTPSEPESPVGVGVGVGVGVEAEEASLWAVSLGGSFGTQGLGEDEALAPPLAVASSQPPSQSSQASPP